MLTLAVVAVSAVISSPASAKARQTAQRLDAFLNNGGYIGGNLVVNGDHSVTTLHVNGTQKKMRQGPTTSPPGGAPGSYTPSYESSLSQMGADANTTGHNAGDWS